MIYQQLYNWLYALKMAFPESLHDYETAFVADFVGLYDEYGLLVLDTLYDIYVEYQGDFRDSLEVVLPWLARLDHPKSYTARRKFIEGFLTWWSGNTIDYVLESLRILNDPASIPALKDTLKRHPPYSFSSSDREAMATLLAELELFYDRY